MECEAALSRLIAPKAWLQRVNIKLTDEFEEFLRNERKAIDDVVTATGMPTNFKNEKNSTSDDSVEDDEDEEEPWLIKSKEELFCEFNKEILNALEEIGGRAFVKLDGVAGKDMANWVPEKCCVNLNEIYIILKESHVIQEHLHQK